MPEYVILLSVPGLRGNDLRLMPRLSSLVEEGDRAELAASFPAITCPVQANLTTGAPPAEHGVVANGSYDRQAHRVEMWTETNACIAAPQIWDLMHRENQSLKSAVWFPLHSKEASADYICTPAPIHNPDGSESLWCYTRPLELYGKLHDQLGHFPLQHFWGPLAGLESTAWIVTSALHAATQYRPNLFYVYIPHLDYAAQKHGPDSEQAASALAELDGELGRLIDGFAAAYAPAEPLWLIASEYVISAVDHVSYPNRALREAGLLKTCSDSDGEMIDFVESRAWAMADHQLSHVFASGPQARSEAAAVLESIEGIEEVIDPRDCPRFDLAHPHSGDLVAISTPNSWQAYYWWLDDSQAPTFARTVDIHRKPGYDPVELFFDPATKGIPLDAGLVRGSHGAPPLDSERRGVLLCSQRGVFVERPLADTDVADIVLRQYGI